VNPKVGDRYTFSCNESFYTGYYDNQEFEIVKINSSGTGIDVVMGTIGTGQQCTFCFDSKEELINHRYWKPVCNVKNKCDCGGVKSNTTHSHWCSSLGDYRER
jgi:hypothetical protein